MDNFDGEMLERGFQVQDKNSDEEINFIFNFALAIYGVALSFSAYVAHIASIFRPADVLFYGNWENFTATIVYGVCLLITVFAFAGCWYCRNWLWALLNRLSTKRFIARIICVFFAFLLGITPYLVYYLAYWLRIIELI